ncbi:hypothetical protein ASD44_09625 [Mesorhizobium sp. Root554]|uniref:hypothetical protein n=1 Tax=unclassified Mesorhizobium TaxID=325217 RepID=UPI00070081FE|nr:MULTISPECIES: hypothetical protein [unclassified Mesorhizobium]KQZ14302.1 hypothetical protein ASD27_09635 [Mesorhizobium sp. Root1471]KQZ36813.1 hypothetical protein ASD44_09625 [Mesorhizobium sp. Root554]
MYSHDPNPSFWETVKVRPPGENGAAETFRARFRALSTEEFGAYDLASPDEARAFLEDVLQDADDVADSAGRPLPFDTALRDSLIRTPHVRMGLVRAYVGAFREAQSGN